MRNTCRLWLHVTDDVNAAIRDWARDEQRSIDFIVSLLVRHALIDVGRYPTRAAGAKTVLDMLRTDGLP